MKKATIERGEDGSVALTSQPKRLTPLIPAMSQRVFLGEFVTYIVYG